MSIWSWLKLTAALWLIRKGFKVVGWLLVAAAAIAAWPLTAVAAIGYLAAWLRGWPPARLWHAAASALPMTAVYAIGQALRLHAWQAVALAPVDDWGQAWRLLAGHAMLRAGLLMAPVAVPAGLAAGGALWAWRIYAITTALAGHSPASPVLFDERQWRRQARTALGTVTAPGAVPLFSARGLIVTGATIRAIRHRWRPVHTLPAPALMRHSVLVGSSGSGKTNLMMRLWAGWYAAALTAVTARGAPRPLLAALDCKGGPDARVKAERTRRLLHGVGAHRVAIWPDEARLSLWVLPPADLAVLLSQMIEAGDGAAAYYGDMLQAAVSLALAAPCGPPATAMDFLDRLDVHGSKPPTATACTTPPSRVSAPPNRTWATSSCGTPPCSADWARRWTVPAPSPTRTPGISSSKAPGNPVWPKLRRWP